MALKVNGARLHTHVNRVFGGNVVAGIYGMGINSLRANLERGNGVLNNFAAGEAAITGVTSRAGLPDGYLHPAAWKLPKTSGGLSAHNSIAGAGSMAGAGAMGVNGSSALTGTGDLSGTGALIISMVAELSGSGGVSSASAQAFLNLAASLAGAGDITGAVDAIAHAAASMEGEGELAALIGAIGNMAGAIAVTGTGLTVENVGSAVWSALAASNNTPATMGAVLNAAGSAGDPWITPLPGSYPAGTAGAILSAVPDAQGVRDAMALATAETPATGSIDKKMAQIKALVSATL